MVKTIEVLVLETNMTTTSLAYSKPNLSDLVYLLQFLYMMVRVNNSHHYELPINFILHQFAVHLVVNVPSVPLYWH